MQNKLQKTVLTLAIGSAMVLNSGCALSPQMINLQTESQLEISEAQVGRSALVRVRDLRETTDQLGTRGGTDPQDSPLLSKPNLQQALQTKMQNSLEQLGFGGASPLEPVKVDLAIEEFNYQCNESFWVNQCQLAMTMRLTIDNEAQKFSQPFTLNEERSVVAAPRQGYNEEWINKSIDKFWNHMMKQPKVQEGLGI